MESRTGTCVSNSDKLEHRKGEREKKVKKRREYVWQEMKVTQIFSGASKQPIKNLSLMKLN